MARPIVIAAGGTGGHFFPAEALAEELVGRGHRIVLMTDSRAGARPSEIFRGREQFVLRGAGIAGRGVLRGAQAVAALGLGTLQARRILAGLGASVVVGFGGYPSVAPVLATRLLRRRPAVVLHEQNAVLGRANRRLARHADLLALSFAHTAGLPEGRATEVTGNPIRPAVARLAGERYIPAGDGRLRVLVLGGSLGARVFSDVVPAALAALDPALRARLSVTQQCRAEDLERVRDAYRGYGIDAVLESFFADVAGLLGQAHVVIARAGASTVAELAVAGRPAILVPLPSAIDDHQSANARALAEAGAAWVMPQGELTPQTLARRLQDLLGAPDALAAAALRAGAQGHADAARRLADAVERQVARAQHPVGGGEHPP